MTAEYVPDYATFEERNVAGTWTLSHENKGMFYICPCGCGAMGYLAFKPAPSPSWEWNGSTDKPTLHPSVHHVNHWHGWLRDGIWSTV